MGNTRERIREAALALFTERGYGGTSIGDIEREAGLAPRAGAFYRHFASKAELAVEIGQTSIIETRQELGLDLLPLGDTKSELILIAKGYLRAHARQAPLADLIAEVRHLPEILELETRVNEDLLEALTGWLSTKPHGRDLTPTQRVALLFTVFGGWIFYLQKRGGDNPPGEFNDDVMLEEWAGLWARILDRVD